eukprot:366510-Chlamydomonas_euryale.AAC.29
MRAGSHTRTGAAPCGGVRANAVLRVLCCCPARRGRVPRRVADRVVRIQVIQRQAGDRAVLPQNQRRCGREWLRQVQFLPWCGAGHDAGAASWTWAGSALCSACTIRVTKEPRPSPARSSAQQSASCSTMSSKCAPRSDNSCCT